MSDTHSMAVAVGVARRSTTKLVKNPLLALSPLAVPLFQFAAFAGAMSKLGSTAGFDYYNFTAFVFVFILFMTTVFAGIFTGIDIATDFSGGFGDRMMLAAPRRLAILGGYLIFTVARALLAEAIVWAVAIATGMPVRGHALELVGLCTLALMVGVATTGWAAGVALRLRTMAAAALIFLPSFLVLFITPDFVPRNLLAGWLKTAAAWNPLTAAFEAGRGYLAHTHAHTALAFGVSAGLMVVFLLWAIRGMKKAEGGPSGPSRPRGPRARRAAPASS
jgi:ABC-2 type transport system permease protein